MAAFLVVYDPSKGKEQEMVAALHRWGATRIVRGTWVLEFDSTADLARRALAGVGGIITCAIVEIKPNGDHAEMGDSFPILDAKARHLFSVAPMPAFSIASRPSKSSDILLAAS